jgi:ATP-dependent Lhr-like helicase
MPATFHPLIRSWFTETYGKPTAVQAEAWPLIERGEHVLALAPTGSGKTLTAFLSAISRFCPGSSASTGYSASYEREEPYPVDQLTVLYVSPLKALNEDIRRNLMEPLSAIRGRFEQAGLTFPDIRVETRSGDTPQSQRRRFLAHPPAILALTPESLAILLLSAKGRQALSTVKYLVLDEIHAVLGNKRGAFLSCQVDRLALIAGEFQRISLSATVRPPEAAAEFVAGLGPNGKGRTVRIVAPPSEKRIELSIEYPDAAADDCMRRVHTVGVYPRALGHEDNTLPKQPTLGLVDVDRIERFGKRYTGLIKYIINRIGASIGCGASVGCDERSTILVFTDSRRRAERLCYFINQEAALQEAARENNGPVAFTHHGSLAKELRYSVEQRLARGELPCVVATASLELGIDIGSVDEVILAGSPPNVSQALQRIGRSGHGVGQVSCGKLFPFHGLDLLMAAAVKASVDDLDIEEVHPIENPLDILAQIILALCVEKNRDIEKLYTLLRGFYIFRNLNHESYIRTVRMLAGLASDPAKSHGSGRLREIKPRIWLDNVTDEIGALDGSLLLLYASGGVIANRGQYSLRLDDGTKIGEVDEEFVWERRLGDQFHFGGRSWRITGIGTEAVEVRPLENPADFIPFWHADTSFRSDKITGRVLAILDQYNANASTPIPALTGFLDSQRETQGDIPLASSTGITVEIIDSPESHSDFSTAVIHTFRGGTINYPLTLALAQELEAYLNLHIESFSNDDSILFLIPRLDTPVEEIIRAAFVSLNGPDPDGGGLNRGERLFRNRLEVSGVFGANFREAAERSLLLPRAGFGQRTPLWITRQRSKRLFDAVSTEDGFPVTAEAWRCCLNDMFDMEGFRDIVASVNDGSITLSFFNTGIPSPFSRDMVRQETNSLMYEYDERKDLPGTSGAHTASLSDKVIQEALGDASLRPPLKRELVDDFTKRLRREIPGWAPEDELSLCEWVKERIAIPLDEWETLCAILPEKLREAVRINTEEEDSSETSGEPASYLQERLKIIKLGEASIASIVHREWIENWENDPITLLGPWLRYEGPVSLGRIAEVFGVAVNQVDNLVNGLVELEEIVRDVQIEGEGDGEWGVRNRNRTSDNDIASESHPDISNKNPHSLLPTPYSPFICDRENLDMLLRLSRKKARPEIRERPAAMLTPFLALRQGLIQTPSAPEADARSNAAFLKKLATCSAPAKLWESEFCTARNTHYSPEIIDREIREGRLVWYGSGREKIGVCPVDDLDLVYTTAGQLSTQTPNMELFTQAINSGFFDRPRDFWDIKEKTGLNSKDCVNALWQEVWQGRLSSDSFEPVRRGVERGFILKETETSGPFLPEQTAARFTGVARRTQIPRALRDRWKGGAPVRGGWFSLAVDWSMPEDSAPDPLDEEMRNRDRVRLLLARWGILCRPLLERESAPFTWSGLLPAMRRMELSGEIIVGRFFAGINSLQFASPSIARDLENAEAAIGSSRHGLYWMNAADPASPAGLEIEDLDPHIPARLSSTRLYFRAESLIAVSNKNGKELQMFVTPDDSDMGDLVELIKIPRTRKVFPESKIIIENINGTPAARSEYVQAFKAAGFVSDRSRLCLW